MTTKINQMLDDEMAQYEVSVKTANTTRDHHGFVKDLLILKNDHRNTMISTVVLMAITIVPVVSVLVFLLAL